MPVRLQVAAFDPERMVDSDGESLSWSASPRQKDLRSDAAYPASYPTTGGAAGLPAALRRCAAHALLDAATEHQLKNCFIVPVPKRLDNPHLCAAGPLGMSDIM